MNVVFNRANGRGNGLFELACQVLPVEPALARSILKTSLVQIDVLPLEMTSRDLEHCLDAVETRLMEVDVAPARIVAARMRLLAVVILRIA